MKQKIVLYIIFISLLSTTSFGLISYHIAPQSEVSEPINTESPLLGIPSLGSVDIINKTTAIKYGILGYLEITPLQETPKTFTLNEQGFNITLELKFTSHTQDLNEIEVKFDPKNLNTVTIEQGLGDGKGTILINDYIHYYPSTNITLKNGESKNVILNVKLPLLTYLKGLKIPIKAIGIITNVPVLDNTEVIVNG